MNQVIDSCFRKGVKGTSVCFEWSNFNTFSCPFVEIIIKKRWQNFTAKAGHSLKNEMKAREI
jgi:hypothetical protein